MNTTIMQALETTLESSKQNSFGSENFDRRRFGQPRASTHNLSTFQRLKILWNRSVGEKTSPGVAFRKAPTILPHADRFQRLFDSLQRQEDRELLVSLLAYRELGYEKVRLSRNTPDYWQQIALAESLVDQKDTYDPHFMNFMLSRFDLRPIGIDIQLYFAAIGITTTFLLEQYSYKKSVPTPIQVEPGNVVLDLGGCWGDTALYFANKTGTGGKVYSFEFIPGNVLLFKINLNLNPDLQSIIQLVEQPVANISNHTIYFQDQGPSSKIVSHPFIGHSGSTQTISIDDFVKENKIDRIDFIKMDIEGAELGALQGAIETLRRFRPNLAIAIYHSLGDMCQIPNWILDLNLGYEIFLDHFTIHSEETVCFARAC